MATLGDIMTSDPFTIDTDTTVSAVAQTMVKKRFGSALVLRGKVLAGIITERDILRATAAGVDASTAQVRDWMTEDPETAESGTDVEEAASMMLLQGFRHLPVVDGVDLVGIVSLRDVLSHRVGKA